MKRATIGSLQPPIYIALIRRDGSYLSLDSPAGREVMERVQEVCGTLADVREWSQEVSDG